MFGITLIALFLKNIKVFLQLIRWPNLAFIALTQFLVVYSVLNPVFKNSPLKPNVSGWNFVLIGLSSILIAAAGYIINDYFDLNIDQVNKPTKIVVEKIIPRRWAILWHSLFSVIAILIGFYVDYSSHIFLLGISNTICVLLLFVYSSTFKRKLLIGNVIISLLTAWVILVICWCEYNHLVRLHNGLAAEKILRIIFLYAGFAFVVSLIREVVKDMEDVEGDRKFNCNTMPIAWGMNASKVFVGVWIIVLIATLFVVQLYALRLEWWWSVLYCSLLIITPLIVTFLKLYQAKSSSDYHKISSLIKLVMLAGIISLIFFRIYS